ncbi:hypothetical protein M3J15_26020 [Klebsiella quasipneumoniae]|uniref:hypothetical protein n=1 Tax=Klebsiella quasipneumoniae TaxID=1463165 RepID=UPI002ABCF1A2|nr:hypothetical protein [Klebsiella quasipneumoniae]MDZ0680089.1 hypothetical protein [Klebsiella quasipneumoniae]MDZ0832031.1 hypothetical protein [Klebsiella quasipneumoniae]MDZ0853462.1 hypothetical protein [Klebsiella quasipneumoniae]MDZ0858670.1 hypothetical protein [Klebsiella quasipneumoniae]
MTESAEKNFPAYSHLPEAKARLATKIALYIVDGCCDEVLNLAFKPALNCRTREQFFNHIQQIKNGAGNVRF